MERQEEISSASSRVGLPGRVRGRATRLLVGALLPALLGALVIWLIGQLRGGGFLAFSLVLAAAYVTVLIPSLVYSALMEFVINPRAAGNGEAVVVSSGLGILAGGGLTFLGMLVGAIVGAALGGFLRWHYNHETKRQEIA